MHALIGQALAELLLEQSIGGVQDVVHDLVGRVDDAHLLMGGLERLAEELLVELLDDLLATAVGAHRPRAQAHARVELSQLSPLGLGLDAVFAQRVDHTLHGDGHWVGARELGAREQSLEHGERDHVLGKHLDGLGLGDAVVERVSQALEKHGELVRGGPAVEHQLAHALDVALGDLADVLGPVLPVDLGAALLDDDGVDGLLQLLVGEVQPHLAVAPVEDGGALSFIASLDRRGGLSVADVDDLDHRRGGHVVLERVHRALEPLVVASQRLQDLPDDLERLGVVERLLGRVAGGHHDGQDDVAVVLAGEAAHHAAHRLHDLDARLLGLQEHDGVEVGHVDALGKAADVGEDVAALVGSVGQPGELLLAVGHVHGAVYVADLALEAGDLVALLALVADVGLHRALEVLGDPLRLGDGGAEGHGILERVALLALALVG